MRSSNWCKNLAEILVSSWKVSSSLWVTSGSLCALGGIHLQHPLCGACCPMPHVSVASLFLSHVLTNINCSAEGRKVLKSQWKSVTKWTGNACVWVDQFYLVSALVSELERLHKHRMEIGTFASRHRVVSHWCFENYIIKHFDVSYLPLGIGENYPWTPIEIKCSISKLCIVLSEIKFI